MSFLKKMAHFLAVPLLITMAFSGILALTLSLNFTDREVVAGWLKEAGTYERLTENLLPLIRHAGESEEESPLSDLLEGGLLQEAGLAEVLSDELTPDYWQGKFEGVINPVYDWLEGTAPSPAATLDFSDKKSSLAKVLEKEVAAQLKNAPVCSVQPASNDFDLFSVNCLPRGLSAQEAAHKFASGLTGQDSPLSKPVVLSQDLEQNLAGAPDLYRQAKDLLWQVPLVTALLVLAVGFTGQTWLRGFRRAGQILFSVGLLMWAGFFVFQRLSRDFSIPVSQDGPKEVVEQLLDPLSDTIATSIATTGMWVSLATVIAGILIWLGTFFWHKVHHGDEAKAIAERSMKQKEADLPKPVEPKTAKNGKD